MNGMKCRVLTEIPIPTPKLNTRMKTKTFMPRDIVRAKSCGVRMLVERSIDSVVHCVWYDQWFRFHEADFPEDSLELIRLFVDPPHG